MSTRREMARGPLPAIVISQAEKLRSDGSEYYKKGRLGAAIDAYTEAIVLQPGVATCYAGRAECFSKKKDWARVEEDSKKAIELEANSVKGHFLLGLALLQRKEYEKAEKELQKALDFGRSLHPPDNQLLEEIWQHLAKVKYIYWEQESSKRAWRLQKLKEDCVRAMKAHLESSQDEAASDGSEQGRINTTLEQLEELAEVFEKVALNDKQAEVPDYLCCKLSLEIFHDPVITPSGITYERAMILDHLRKVGQFDPTTRAPLEAKQLVPNLAMKEAVLDFLQRHGWAYRTATMDDTY